MSSNEQRFRHALLEFVAGQKIRAWEQTQHGTPPKVTGALRRAFMYADTESITDAVYRQDSMYLDGIYDDCIGIMRLKRQDSYVFLKDIEDDKVSTVVEKLVANRSTLLGGNHFFKFKLRSDRTYFLNPGHVAQTPKMIAALGSFNIDFKEPDSEGRLPFFFIARYAKNRWAVPLLCNVFNASANDSGSLPENFPLPAILHDEEAVVLSSALEKKLERAEQSANRIMQDIDQPVQTVWDPPIARAIKYRNRETLLGLNLLPENQVDWNIPFQWNRMSPLIYAVLLADEIVHSRLEWDKEAAEIKDINLIPTQKYSRWEAAKALWIVKFLAGHPQVNPHFKDLTGQDAKGYAYTNSVRNALQQGLRVRNLTKNYSQPIPR